MNKRTLCKKIACVLVLANLASALAVTGCSSKNEIDPSGTPEVTEAPMKSVTEMFAVIGKCKFPDYGIVKCAYRRYNYINLEMCKMH